MDVELKLVDEVEEIHGEHEVYEHPRQNGIEDS